MADGGQTVAPPRPVLREDGACNDGAVIVALGGARYALPVAYVVGIIAAPAVCRVPHAPPALLGAANVAGQVLPIIDLATALPERGGTRRDGGGEVVRLRVDDGDIGLWVDRVERLLAPGQLSAAAAVAIDPASLAKDMAAPSLAAEAHHPLGDVREIDAAGEPEGAEVAAYILVETANVRAQLARDVVLEFVEALPWVPLPDAPPGLIGVGILRGDALPVFSLAALLGLPAGVAPRSFAVIAFQDGRRLAVGFDRLIGLRSQGQDAAEATPIFDPATLPSELRRIVSAFAPPAATGSPGDASEDGAAGYYLTFIAAGQRYALPLDAVDRVVPPRPVVALPRCGGGRTAIAGAIELQGHVMPLAYLPADMGVSSREAEAHVILRGPEGPLALAVDRAERLVALRPDDIVAAPGEQDVIDGVAVLDGDLLRILAPGKIGGGA